MLIGNLILFNGMPNDRTDFFVKWLPLCTLLDTCYTYHSETCFAYHLEILIFFDKGDKGNISDKDLPQYKKLKAAFDVTRRALKATKTLIFDLDSRAP